MTPLRVYLCARFGRQAEMRTVARWLEGLGYVITSRWLDALYDSTDAEDEERWATKCLEDVFTSDVLVAFSDVDVPGAARGGRHVELGIALGVGLDAITVGKPENIFFRLTTAVDSLTGMAHALGELSNRNNRAQATT